MRWVRWTARGRALHRWFYSSVSCSTAVFAPVKNKRVSASYNGRNHTASVHLGYHGRASEMT